METILIQLDTDPDPSTFDAVVAIDAGAEHLLRHGNVNPANVASLVHGAMFTRGGSDLKNTAIFVGGSNVEEGERVFRKVLGTFFGPVRVSAMMDANGSNTTASAAVLLAGKHIFLGNCRAVVLGGTGPVGYRAAQLLAAEGAHVRVASRSLERAQLTCKAIAASVKKAKVFPCALGSATEREQALAGAELMVAAGAAGVQFLAADQLWTIDTLKVAIDLNAVPPAGLDGIQVTDKGTDRNSVICYGAIGVGGTKMKIHKACVARLFTANDMVLDTEAIFAVGRTIVGQPN